MELTYVLDVRGWRIIRVGSLVGNIRLGRNLAIAISIVVRA